MFQLPMSGRHDGDLRLENDLDFCGLVTGTVTVPPGLRLRLYGQICGDLIVQKDGQASIYGSISGVVQNQGAVRILGRAGCLEETAHAATVINDRAAMGPMPPPLVKVRARLPEIATPPAAT